MYTIYNKSTNTESVESIAADLVLCRAKCEQYRIDAELSEKNLLDTQEQLTLSRIRIVELNRNFLKCETLFLYTLEEAPVPIFILKGEDLIIESANSMLMKTFSRSSSILHTPFKKAFPELDNPVFMESIKEVYVSGKA